jgi:hypothetical protein
MSLDDADAAGESIRTELGLAEDLVRELLSDETLGDQTELPEPLLGPAGSLPPLVGRRF